jgi:DedD protein
MGLFSFLNKNKQDSSTDVSGRFSRADDELAERARAKRASHAGGGARKAGADDPMLPEKKRARRRLVGAVALALAAAIGLPMLLDSEPKPLAGDVAIQIPAKDKAGPLPMPSAPASVPADAEVAASQSVDKGEEVVEPPKPSKPAAAPAPAPVAESARKVAEVQAPPIKAEPPKAPAVEHKTEPAHADPVKAEHKDKPKAEAKPEAAKDHPAKKEDKPAHVEDAARAMAILEGKEAAKARESADKVVLQVAALGSQEKVAELQGKLRDAGIRSFTEKYHDLIRVKIGPYSHDEAEKVRGQLSKLGLSGRPAS